MMHNHDNILSSFSMSGEVDDCYSFKKLKDLTNVLLQKTCILFFFKFIPLNKK